MADFGMGINFSNEGDYSLRVLDISNPTNPTELGYLSMGDPVKAITLSNDGTKAYVANGDNGLLVIDISNPTNLTKLNTYDTTGHAYDVALSNDETKAYIADGSNGLVVIDLDLYN